MLNSIIWWDFFSNSNLTDDNYYTSKIKSYMVENKDKYIYSLEIPGAKELKIIMKEKCLHISGVKRGEKFLRRLNLTKNIDCKKISSKYVNGILEIYLPKKEELEVEIPIKVK
jgi:HSP20 family molecular chaperone IbpA